MGAGRVVWGTTYHLIVSIARVDEVESAADTANKRPTTALLCLQTTDQSQREGHDKASASQSPLRVEMQAASLASLRIVPAATGQSEGGACKFRSRSKDHRRQAVRLLTSASHRLDDGGYDRPAAGKRAVSPGASRGEQAKQPLATQLRCAC